jgi:hypothetical protein
MLWECREIGDVVTVPLGEPQRRFEKQFTEFLPKILIANFECAYFENLVAGAPYVRLCALFILANDEARQLIANL